MTAKPLDIEGIAKASEAMRKRIRNTKPVEDASSNEPQVYQSLRRNLREAQIATHTMATLLLNQTDALLDEVKRLRGCFRVHEEQLDTLGPKLDDMTRERDALLDEVQRLKSAKVPV